MPGGRVTYAPLESLVIQESVIRAEPLPWEDLVYYCAVLSPPTSGVGSQKTLGSWILSNQGAQVKRRAVNWGSWAKANKQEFLLPPPPQGAALGLPATCTFLAAQEQLLAPTSEASTSSYLRPGWVPPLSVHSEMGTAARPSQFGHNNPGTTTIHLLKRGST